MSDKIVFSVSWFDVVARTANTDGPPHYVLRTSDYVSVLATTASGSILLVRQYRPSVQSETLELPSGHVEDNESPESAARRELAEETGHEAQTLEHLGTLLPDPGRQDNKLWCFYASGATPVRAAVQREEGVELVRCDMRELLRYIREGKLAHAANLGVVLLAAMKGYVSVRPALEPPK